MAIRIGNKLYPDVGSNAEIERAAGIGMIARGGTTPPKVMRLPIDQVEHGESATPGGQLTWPQSAQTIRDYAARPTPFPAIEVMPPEKPGGKWMVYDGSLRLEAAKLRGDKFIDAINPFPGD